MICTVGFTKRFVNCKFSQLLQASRRISSQSHRCIKRKLQKAQSEINVFFKTPQSKTGQDYANANGVNARVFLSAKMQPAFRPLIAHQESRIDKKFRETKFCKIGDTRFQASYFLTSFTVV